MQTRASASLGASTRCVHLAGEAGPATGSIVPPVVTSSAFAYPDVASWRDAALGLAPGHIDSRNSHPATGRFEAKVAALEMADAAASFATGMAAITSTLLALLSPGQRAVTVRDAYGGTCLLFTQVLPHWGVDCVVLDTDDQQGLAAAVHGCDLVYLETPANPALKVLDIARLSLAAHATGALVVVDNTVATPVNQTPLPLGADLVIHSGPAFPGGHGDALGGVVAGNQGLITRIRRFREIAGTGMDPQVASLMLRSLKTLGLRAGRRNATALQIARWLESHPKVAAVHYPGLVSHPQHELAAAQMTGFGGVLSFELAGGFAAAGRVLPRLRYACLAANLGQAGTITGPPVTTSHAGLAGAGRAAAAVPEGLVRYSAGIEDPADLITDLALALQAA
ncbi:MAG TPA: PLP-dependent transferase [Streptosporangiaceae bacterium]